MKCLTVKESEEGVYLLWRVYASPYGYEPGYVLFEHDSFYLTPHTVHFLFYFILFKQEYKTSEDILQLTSVFKFHYIYSNIGEILKMNIFGSLASNLNTRSNKYDQCNNPTREKLFLSISVPMGCSEIFY